MDELLRERLSAYYKRHSQGEFIIDDITWDDLNMDDVFARIDRTSSSLGEELLYGMLRVPSFSEEELSGLERDIIGYAGDEGLLKDAKKSLKSLSKLKKISIFEYLYKIGEIKELKRAKLFVPLLLILIAAAFLFINVPLGVILIVLAFSVNTINYFKLTKDIKPYLICFAYIARAIRAGESIAYIDKARVKELKRLTRGLFILGTIEGQTASGATGSPLDIFADLLKMGFHFDIIKFYNMVSFVKNNMAKIEEYLSTLGRIDAVISISDLRYELPYYCVPEFSDKKGVEVKAAVHPLIEDCVPNSIAADKSILLTGSNASGKSTFLKCIAINAIFAQSIHTCFAESYTASFFKVISSMSHRDNILSGDSYYMAEIKAMKRILELIGEDTSDGGKDCDPEVKPSCGKAVSADTGEPYILCFVDEILSGTNTVERISAGTQILKYLDNKKTICFAATHDIELTSLLEGIYENYHFKEEVTDNDISFSYRLLTGRTNSRNAIKLLALMDFGDDIVRCAQEMADGMG